MHTKLHRPWGAFAVVSLVLALPTALNAQNEESDDSQRDPPPASTTDRDADMSRERSRLERRGRSESGPQTEQDEDQRGREPWENRSRSRVESRDWEDDASASRQPQSDRPGLGVSFSANDDRPIVRQVHPGSPAEEMGLRPGDRIARVNGEAIETSYDVIELVRRSEPGEDIEIEVRRDGDEQSFEGELETRREALVLRTYQGRQSRLGDRDRSRWDYGTTRRSYSMAGEQYSQEVRGQLDSLERQVEQISRELARLRRSLDNEGSPQSQARSRWDDRQRFGRGETQADYSESDSDRNTGSRTSYDYYEAPSDSFGDPGRSYEGGSSRGQE